VSDDVTGPIGQSFVVGRVRVVTTDSCSQRTSPGESTGTDQQILGAEQEAWFVEELAEARADGQVVLWAGSTPWIGEAVTLGDTWAGYAAARQRLADLLWMPRWTTDW
jgi:phosphodiesterase/alkaline phosphatase D-like protein